MVALVCYDIPGPDLWHERLVCAEVIGDEFVVVSPDGEMFVEQLCLETNDDTRGLRFKTPAGGMPPGMGAGAQVYGFAEPITVQTRRDWIAEGLVMASVERRRRGLPGVVAEPAAAGRAGAAAGGAGAGQPSCPCLWPMGPPPSPARLPLLPRPLGLSQPELCPEGAPDRPAWWRLLAEEVLLMALRLGRVPPPAPVEERLAP